MVHIPEWPFGQDMNIAFGLITNVIATLFSSTGLMLMKYSHIRGHETAPVERWGGYSILQDKTWWLGLVCLASAGVLNGTSVFLCPLSLLAPLSGLTIVTNSLFAKWFLGEKLENVQLYGRTVDVEVVGTAIIVIGTVLCATSGAHTDRHYTSSQLLELFVKPNMLIFYVPASIVMGVGLWVVRSPHFNKSWYEAVSYANMCGIAAALQQLFLKTVMELVKAKAFDDPALYIMVFLVVCGVSAQLTTLNLALARHASVFWLPMYQSCLVWYGLITGGIFFQEFNDYTVSSWIITPAGLILIWSGLWLFSYLPEQEPDPETPIKIEAVASPGMSPVMFPENQPLVSRKNELSLSQSNELD